MSSNDITISWTAAGFSFKPNRFPAPKSVKRFYMVRDVTNEPWTFVPPDGAQGLNSPGFTCTVIDGGEKIQVDDAHRPEDRGSNPYTVTIKDAKGIHTSEQGTKQDPPPAIIND